MRRKLFISFFKRQIVLLVALLGCSLVSSAQLAVAVDESCNRHFESAIKVVVDTPVMHLFSINAEGDKVLFSRGNLQYNPSGDQWRFALRQFDRVGNGKAANPPSGAAFSANNYGVTTVFYDSIDYSTPDPTTKSGFREFHGVPCNNLLKSKYYGGWIDAFAWGTSGHGKRVGDQYAVHFYPYNVSDATVDATYNAYGYGPSWDGGQGAGALSNDIDTNSGSNCWFDWGYGNYIREYIGSTFDERGDLLKVKEITTYRRGVWRTLTADEWRYLLLTRRVAGEDSAFSYVRLRYGKLSTDTVMGVVIYPDDFHFGKTGIAFLPFAAPTVTEIDMQTWSNLEEEGCVFLPCGSSVTVDKYWSSSANSAALAYSACLYGGEIMAATNRFEALLVRLVQDYYWMPALHGLVRKDTIDTIDCGYSYVWDLGYDSRTLYPSTSEADYYDTIRSFVYARDSIISHLHLVVKATRKDTIDTIYCAGNYAWDLGYRQLSIYQSASVDDHYDTLRSVVTGCDSILSHLELHVLSSPITYQDTIDTVAFGETYCWDLGYKKELIKPTQKEEEFHDTLPNQYGCDSVISYLKLVSLTDFRDTVDTLPCGASAYSWELPANRVRPLPALSGTHEYFDTLRSVQGYDSVITHLKLTVRTIDVERKPFKYDTLPCGLSKYTWTIQYDDKRMVDLDIIQAEGTHEHFDTLRSVYGCDSVIWQLELTNRKIDIERKPFKYDTLPCGLTSYRWLFKYDSKRTLDSTITQTSGTHDHFDTLRSVYGCDSVIAQLKLTVKELTPLHRDTLDSITHIITPGEYSFSINADGDKILFSPGNLQYCAAQNKWRFAERQFDRCGDGGNESTVYWNNDGTQTKCDNQQISSTYGGWIDLFGWGTGDNPTKTSSNDNDYSTFTDWGTNVIGSDPANTWRTPTAAEWSYLLQTRKVNGGAGYSCVRLKYGDNATDTVTGVVLYPDDFTFANAGVSAIAVGASAGVTAISADTWKKLEATGVVFLPGTGNARGSDLGNASEYGLYASYWSATQRNNTYVYAANFYFLNRIINPKYDQIRYNGCAVRLIRDISPDELQQPDTCVMSYVWKKASGDQTLGPKTKGIHEYRDTVRSVGGCDSIISYLKLTVKHKELERRDTIDSIEHIIKPGKFISGDFSISATQKVKFSSGNLQYCAKQNKWRFAERQFDRCGNGKQAVVPGGKNQTAGYGITTVFWNDNGEIKPCNNLLISSTYGGWIDLFGWGTGDNPTKTSSNDNDYSTFTDWGINVIGNDTANTWRTPTSNEWTYLLQTRKVNGGAGYSYVRLKYGNNATDTVTGIVIYPDDFTFANAGVTVIAVGASAGVTAISADTWKKLEATGVVFLPGSRNRNISGGQPNINETFYGLNTYYWSASAYYASSAYNAYFSFNGRSILPANFYNRYNGFAVRLIRDVSGASAGSLQEPDTCVMSYTWKSLHGDQVLAPKEKGLHEYYDTIKSVNGCDSVISTLKLTVKHKDLERRDDVESIEHIIITPTDTCFSSYKWKAGSGDQPLSPKEKGLHEYFDTVRSVAGLDSIISTLKLIVKHKELCRDTIIDSVEHIVTKTDTCVMSYVWKKASGDQTLAPKAKGIHEYFDTVQSIGGCDSIISYLKLNVKHKELERRDTLDSITHIIMPVRGFTVNASSNNKILFASGNLQYQASTNTWRFAERQFDRCGQGGNESTVYWNNNGTQNKCDNLLVSETYGGWIDLFGWGTSGVGSANPPYYISTNSTDYTKSDWGQNVIGNDPANTWRTPTKYQWDYLLTTRQVNGGAGYSFVRLKYGDNPTDTVTGVVIYPDDFTFANAGVSSIAMGASAAVTAISADTWNKLEAVGCVFLPGSNFRSFSSDQPYINEKNYGLKVRYWSATAGYYNTDAYYAYFSFYDRSFTPVGYAQRYYGFAVRLIRDASADTCVMSYTWHKASGNQILAPKEAGVHEYADTIKSVNGCDSVILTLKLKVKHKDLEKKPFVYDTLPCGLSDYTWTIKYDSKRTVTKPIKQASGTQEHFDTLRSVQGCDSVIAQLKLTVQNLTVEKKPFVYDTVCNLNNYTWSITYDSKHKVDRTFKPTEGTTEHFDTLRSIYGCDSVIARLKLSAQNLTAKIKPYSAMVEPHATYSWNMEYKTKSLTAPGVVGTYEYSDTLRSKYGCDSIISNLTLTVSGYFSVSATKKVKIAPGNLQYCAAQNKWRFAERQFDRCGSGKQAVVPGGKNQTAGYGITTVFWNDNGEIKPCNNMLTSKTYGGWIDIFGWGTSNKGTEIARSYPWKTSANEEYGPNGVYNIDVNSGKNRSYDWGYLNEIYEGTKKHAAGTWRTPTNAEWTYMIATRKVNGAIGWSVVRLKYGNNATDTVTGIVVYPDNFTFTKANMSPIAVGGGKITEIGADIWDILRNAGCTFLPGVSYRGYYMGNPVLYDSNYGVYISYWSATVYNTYGALQIKFDGSNFDFSPGVWANRYNARTVRLVQDVK